MQLPEANADKLFSILLNEYNRIFDQKSRLEAKAIGYITIESLILSFSIGLITFYLVQINLILNDFSKIFILFFIGVIYFGIIEIIVSVRALVPRFLVFIDDYDISNKSLDEKESDYSGSIIKSLLSVNRENRKIIVLISFYNDLSYLFLLIDFCFVIVLVMLFFYYICKL